MAVKVETVGSGSIGEITPGWSAQEYATPAEIGGRAGGSGGISFSAKKNDDSAFVLNNDSTFTHDELGFIRGTIKSVNASGLVASLTQSSDMSDIDGDYEIPGLVCSGAHQSIDLINQVTKKDIRLKPGLTGSFWSLAGHNGGFNSSGEILEHKENIVNYKWIGSPSNTNYKKNVITCTDAVWTTADSYSYHFGKLYTSSVRGDTIISDVANPNYFVGFKTFIASPSGYSRWSVNGFPFDSVTNTDRTIVVTVDRATSKFSIMCEYRSGGVVVDDFIDVDISFFDFDTQEVAVFIEYKMIQANIDGTYSYKIIATIVDTTSYISWEQLTLDFIADAMPIYYDQWRLESSGTGYNGYRAVWVDNDIPKSTLDYLNNPVPAYPFDYLNDDYEVQPSYELSSQITGASSAVTPVTTKPVLGGTYNLWQFLQDACSANNQQVFIANGMFKVFSNYERIISLSNFTPPPSITVESFLAGQSISVVHNNSTTTTEDYGVDVTDRDEIYNVYTDKNRIISVEAGETIVTTVKTGNYLLSLIPPYKTSVYPNPIGSYAICDSTGGNVSNTAWANYGGDVKVFINDEDSGSIDIKVIGPTREIPGKTAPYSVAYSSGEEKYAALSVVGTGIKGEKETLNVLTGAIQNKTSQQNSGTINNPHISTLEQAYDSAMWATSKACGVRVSLSATIPVSSIDGFGFTAGSCFEYDDAIYRIDSSSVSNLAVSITATLYTTCENFDSLWSARTVEFHDDLWGSNEVQDQIVKPLWKAEISGVYMTADTDGAVTWTDEEFGTATFALDTDGVPYVIFTTDDEDNTLIYLDTDFTPYYV